MIDPVHSLAFSIQANPGVYAILLGSGVSRAAKIPTGWDITLDLIRKIASLSKETCEPDPEKWYRCRFGRAPEYSDLLDAIAKTPAERQQLLRSYWEPDEDEREDGWKQPTAAHGSIAALAAGGFIRVIVTTNFDRLMEAALNDAGVVPTVLSSPDQVEGALPIVHTRCCLFKVHGDYLDPRIRNTPVELASYPDVYDTLLDRIFDEFGLVVCGWSAGWGRGTAKCHLACSIAEIRYILGVVRQGERRGPTIDRTSRRAEDPHRECGRLLPRSSSARRINRGVLETTPSVRRSGCFKLEEVRVRTTLPCPTVGPR